MKNALHFAFAAMFAAAAMPARAAAPAPLGMTIGATPCADAMKRIGAPKLEGNGEVQLEKSTNAETAYPGATAAFVLCRRNVLDAVVLTIGKGGMGNPAGQEVYKVLASKYAKVAGGPIPSIGDGMARFESDGVTVEIVSPHLSFEFELSYMSKQVWDTLQANARRKKEDAQKVKTGSL